MQLLEKPKGRGHDARYELSGLDSLTETLRDVYKRVRGMGSFTIELGRDNAVLYILANDAGRLGVA